MLIRRGLGPLLRLPVVRFVLPGGLVSDRWLAGLAAEPFLILPFQFPAAVQSRGRQLGRGRRDGMISDFQHDAVSQSGQSRRRGRVPGGGGAGDGFQFLPDFAAGFNDPATPLLRGLAEVGQLV